MIGKQPPVSSQPAPISPQVDKAMVHMLLLVCSTPCPVLRTAVVNAWSYNRRRSWLFGYPRAAWQLGERARSGQGPVADVGCRDSKH